MSKTLTKKEEHRYVAEGMVDFKRKSLFLKKVGLWGGTALGKTGDSLTAYKKEFTDLVSEKGSVEDLAFNKLSLDLEGALTKSEIQNEIDNIKISVEKELVA